MQTHLDANLVRIAYAFASTEETRYYLNGVNVEPAPNGDGAVITATDGHRLFSAIDRSAMIDPDAKPFVLQVPKDALKLCRPKKDARRIIVNHATLTATIHAVDSDIVGDVQQTKPVSAPFDCIIDGTFPDWRRVMPGQLDATASTSFEGKYLASFAAAGDELAKHEFNGANITTTQILSASTNAPAWIRWSGIDDAFGVLIPRIMPSHKPPQSISHPAWTRAKPALVAVA